MGIKNFHWKKTPTGYPDALGGLYLEVQDLAKIGYLMLNNGTWDGQQIISSEWVKRSVSKHVTFENEGGYGYQWWIPAQDNGQTEIFSGIGYGGQYVFVAPAYDIVAVFNGWNIHSTPELQTFRALQDRILPATQRE